MVRHIETFDAFLNPTSLSARGFDAPQRSLSMPCEYAD